MFSKLKRSHAYTPEDTGSTSGSAPAAAHRYLVQGPDDARAQHPPPTESLFAHRGRYPRWGELQFTSAGVTRPSSLLLAHAPDHSPPRGSARCSSARSLQVAASPCWKVVLPDIIPAPLAQELGPVARRLPHSELAHFFPEDIGLAPNRRRSANGRIPAMQLPQGA
jgi:hypothetical protein